MRSAPGATLIGAWPVPRRVEREIADAVPQHRPEALGHVLLAAVEPRDRDHERRRRAAFGHLDVADDLLALERQAHDLERRIEQLAVRQERRQRLVVGLLLARRVRHRPARERVIEPGLQEILVGRGPARRRLRLAPFPCSGRRSGSTPRPVVALQAVDAGQRLAHLVGLEADQGIGAAVGPRLCLLLELVERCAPAMVRRRRAKRAARSPRR